MAKTASQQAPDETRRPLSRRVRAMTARLGELGRGPDYLVADKPTGLAVQGGTGIRDSVASLADTIFADMPRLRLVHRLDKETSGCLVLAASLAFARAFQQQLKNREVEKEYLCLVHGSWDERMQLLQGELPQQSAAKGAVDIHRSARGRQAATEVEVIWRADNYSLLLARPLTGRTHQLRIQFSDAGHPLVGDGRYGSKERKIRLCLHAWRISFLDMNGRRKRYTAPVPKELGSVFARLGIDSSGLSS